MKKQTAKKQSEPAAKERRSTKRVRFTEPTSAFKTFFPTAEFPDQLAAIPPATIAGIAATLVNQGRSPVEAVNLAFELLELAVGGVDSLRKKVETSYCSEKGYDFGVWYTAVLRAIHRNSCLDIEQEPNPIFHFDNSGNYLPLDFDVALQNLLPRLTPVDRMPRFRQWLAHTLDISSIEAGDKVASYYKDGLPPDIYSSAKIYLRVWWNDELKKIRAVAGSQKGAKKRGQVRKPLNDGRLGARPPKDDIFEKIKKTI